MTKYRLEQIGKIVGGGTPSTKKPQYYTNKGISWITPKDLSGYSKMYISHGARDISKEGLENSSAKLLPKSTVLVSSRAPIGYVALAANEIATNQGFKSIVPDVSKVLPKYLYYLMLTKKEELESISSGSTFKEISGKVMKKFEVDIPVISKQKEIIHKVDPVIKKIELNNQINANLDELMSEIFERYVIEANVFTTDSLSNIANYKNGLAMQRFRPNGADKGLPVLKIKELNQGFTDLSSDRCSSKISNDVIVKTGDIIFSWSGTLIVKIWTGTTCGLNQHLFKVTSDKYPKWFIYKWTEYYLRQFQSIAAGKATTMGHIKRSDLKQAEVRIPYKSEIDRLDKLISPIFKRYVNNILEINSLKELKNELLSKLF